MKKDATIRTIRTHVSIFAAALMAFAVTPVARATTAVYTATVSAFSSELSSANRDASKTVDSSGLLGGVVPATINSIADLPNHNEEASNMWLTANGSGHVAYIVFDLGAVEPVNILYVWNYAEQNTQTQFGIPHQNILDAEGANAVSIYSSATAITPSLTTVNGTVINNGTLVESTNFAQETFASVPSDVDTAYNATPQEVDFPTIQARYIELAINSNFPGASSDLVGLSEVRLAFVPEPGAGLLLVFGGIAMLARRRKVHA